MAGRDESDALRSHSRSRLGVAVIGIGWMGAFHARTLAESLPQFDLQALVDPDQRCASKLGEILGVTRVLSDVAEIWDDPSIDAVVIASPPNTHADLIVAAARCGKAVFCEKPASLSTDELRRVINVVEECRTVVHVGFNRRFSPDFSWGQQAVKRGEVGTPLQLRSLTRDPDLLEPGTIKRNAIFLETLIHDFDLLQWLQPGARAVEVTAVADALIRPDWKDQGLLDTAVVTIRYSTGSIAVAEACLQTSYGYDVRAEVLGSDGLLMLGSPQIRGTDFYGGGGLRRATFTKNIQLFAGAYRAELAAFFDAVTNVIPPGVDDRVATLHDALAALLVAEAAIVSSQQGGRVRLTG